MEIWDLYNEKRELTGKTHIREQKVPQGFYHLVVHVWIKNSKAYVPPQAKFCPNICKQKITPEYLIGEKRRENASA